MFNINTGTNENTYKEFTLELQPRGIIKLGYVHTTFFIKELDTPESLAVNWAGSGEETSFSAGIIVEHPNNVAVPYVEIRNTTDQTVKTVVAMSNGKIYDNRLTTTAVLPVRDINAGPFNIASIETKTFDSTGKITFDPNGAIFTRIQAPQTNENPLFLYQEDGFEVYATGTENLTLSEPFDVYGTEGEKVIFGRFI